MEKSEQQSKNRGGRPFIAEGDVRERIIGVRVNDREHRLLGEKAKESGMTTSDFLRRIGLGYEVPKAIPPLNRQAYRELGEIIYRLEELVGSPDSDGQRGGAIIAAAAREAATQIQRLRLDLLGATAGEGDDEAAPEEDE